MKIYLFKYIAGEFALATIVLEPHVTKTYKLSILTSSKSLTRSSSLSSSLVLHEVMKKT